MKNSLTPSKNSTLSFVSLIAMFGLVLLLISAFFSYVLVEARTNFYADELESANKMCEITQSKVKFVKVLDYNKYKKFAKLYCGYYESAQNRIIELNYTTQWKVVLDKKVNRERGLHWPIYL